MSNHCRYDTLRFLKSNGENRTQTEKGQKPSQIQMCQRKQTCTQKSRREHAPIAAYICIQKTSEKRLLAKGRQHAQGDIEEQGCREVFVARRLRHYGDNRI